MRPRTAQIVAEWSSQCDAEVSIAVLGGTWKPSVLALLGTHGVLRFGELRRHLVNPTAKVLTRQLRELEADGLVVRTVYAEVPPKVEYSLSDLGHSVQPVIGELARWGAHYAAPARRGLASVAE